VARFLSAHATSNWLPSYLPELDGLRGLAILGVVLYHCDPLVKGTWVHFAAQWGWAGVNLFFVLSGFLITSNLLATREKPHYFHNFHARRALRIWPVYVLVLAVVYLNAPWFIGPSVLGAIKAAPWLAYIFFVQNLFHLALPPAIGPTWALAVEEQYYFVWAPLVRWLRRPWMLAAILLCALACSPLLRIGVHSWLTPNHTLIKLDGIALGSLLALGMYTLGSAAARGSGSAWEPLRWDLPPRLRSPADGVSRLGAHAGLCRRGAGLGGLDRGAQSGQRRAAQRTAGLLWPHQLRPLHDPYHGLHLLWLVRPVDEALWDGGQLGDSGRSAGGFDRAGRRAVVWLRVADSQTEAAFLARFRASAATNSMQLCLHKSMQQTS